MTIKFPHIERRLTAYGEFMRMPIKMEDGVTCTLAQIIEMGPMMGNSGSGGTPSDGGHLMRYFRNRREIGEVIRAFETHTAVQSLHRAEWRQLVNVTFVDVPRGSEPRSERVAAEFMKISRDDYRLMRMAVFGALEAKLDLAPTVFEVLPDEDDEAESLEAEWDKAA